MLTLRKRPTFTVTIYSIVEFFIITCYYDIDISHSFLAGLGVAMSDIIKQQVMDLAEIIEHIPSVVLRLSHREDNWTTWFVTQNISMLGYSKEEFMDGLVRWFDIVHPDDRVLLSKQVGDYESRGIDEFRLYYRVVKKSGDVIPVQEYNTVIRDDAGQVFCYDTVITPNTHMEAGKTLIDAHNKQQVVLNDILMSLHASDLDHALQIILDSTGAYLDTSRALLFRDSPDHTTCKVVYEWCNKGISSVMDLDYSITYSTEMPEIYVALQDTGMLLVNAGEIPENCREEFENEGLVSSAIFAVYLDGEHYGFVCFDDCVVERRWDDDTARFLKNISNLISTVLVRQRSARLLEQSQKTCETVLNNLDSLIFAKHPETGEIIFANKAFKLAFGASCEGKNYRKYLDIDLLGELAAGDKRRGASSTYHEYYNQQTDKWLGVSCDYATWVDGQKVCLVHCHDITSQKMYEETITRRAYLDHLTGLPNRYRCDVDLQRAIREAKMAGATGYVLFIDMDDFKIVNDCYGHDYGDGVLRSFAEFLKEHFHEPNMVFRFGGDEFLILISHEYADRLEEYLQLLMDRATKPWRALDKVFYCSLSIGVKDFPGNNENQKSIIKNADIAMYEAKKSGKNQYALYENILGDETIVRSHMEDLLRRSMLGNFEGFEVYYQPVQNVKTGRLKGAEALLRMFGDDGEMLLPGDFMPLAEYLGFMVPIGEYVLRRAAEQCRRINEAGYPDFTMTVNLSSKQLNQKNIVSLLERILGESGVNLGNIIIGINEGLLAENAERMTAICTELTRAGLRLALDDFGGGTCSFLHLRDLPVEIIKISPQFIQQADDPYCRYFIETAIHMSHLMKKTVCVNGVEDADQMELCGRLGADFLQGFHFHRPDRSDILYTLLEN